MEHKWKIIIIDLWLATPIYTLITVFYPEKRI